MLIKFLYKQYIKCFILYRFSNHLNIFFKTYKKTIEIFKSKNFTPDLLEIKFTMTTRFAFAIF